MILSLSLFNQTDYMCVFTHPDFFLTYEQISDSFLFSLFTSHFIVN